MKLPFATLLVALSATLPAAAQTGAPGGQAAQTKPKPATVAPPKLQTPSETAQAMAQTERVAIQSDLAWTGYYNGLVNGEVSDRMVAAIKAFQKQHGGKETGVLNPEERAALAEAARKPQANVGWKIATDMVTGARIGLPLKLAPNTSSNADGSKWWSPTNTIQIALDRRKQAGATLTAIADSERKANARRVDYTAVKPDFFVVTGMQGLKKLYVRGAVKGDEVRIMTVLYDQALEGTMDRVTVAMSSAFVPFPGNNAPAAPPRNTVEYSTGIVVSSDGLILADRQAIDGCESVIVSSRINADRIAQDEANDFALLHVYGVNDLKPLPIGDAAAKSPVIVTGIANPQGQNGEDAVTSINATATSESVLSPAPPAGFSGAPVINADGSFAGVARLRPAVVAGPATGLSGSFVSATTVSAFLRTNNVTPASGAPDPKASVVRLICARK